MTGADPAHRAGFVALAGRSNVGKSTLLNRLVGHKVAAVTPRPQTTRRRILGIRSDPDAQLLLIDMPGIHEPHKLINQRMVETARHCVDEGEVIVAVVEAGERLSKGDRELLRELRELPQATSHPVIVALNKIDLIKRAALIPVVEECARELPAAEIVPLSALSGENLAELVSTIKRMLPAGPPLMPDDQYTDQTERSLAEEMIREKIFLAMRQEIPFSTAVKVEEFTEERERRLKRVSALIVVDRDSHKGMLIGAGGVRLKEIGSSARLELEQMLDSHIFLKLTVKVEKNWTRDPRKLDEYGI